MADCPPLPVSILKAGWANYLLCEMDLHRSVVEDTFGTVDHVAFTIHIVFAHGYAQAAKTLLHECLHIIHRMWNTADGDNDERRAQAVSHGFSTLWRDNPELFKWIGKGLMNG